jgi:hypothetical protein
LRKSCKLYTKSELNGLELTTTRYEIANNIYPNRKSSISKKQFERIMLSLKKWESTSITYEGIFYDKGSHTIRYFHIIDDVILNLKSKELYIRFNQQYIQQLKQSTFYKLIDFTEYKKLTRALSARLYEILVKNFKERNIWHIDISNLAEKLTLEKRVNAEKYYPSQIIISLKPAINEINKNTQLRVELNYHAENGLCEFKKIAEAQEQVVSASDAIVDYPSPLMQSLRSYEISAKKAQGIIDCYPEDKIKHKLELLKHSKQAIKNVAAWLIKALEEDWSTVQYDKHMETQKLKLIADKKRELKEAHEKYLELLKQEYAAYKKAKAYELFKQFPPVVQDYINQEFELWLRTYGTGPLSKEECKAAFMADKLLNKQEYSFDSWRAEQEKLVE